MSAYLGTNYPLNYGAIYGRINALTPTVIRPCEARDVSFPIGPLWSDCRCQQPNSLAEGANPLTEIPDHDSIEKFKADLLNEPGVVDGMRERLEEDVETFLKACARVAARIQLMDDVWAARRIIADWAIAMAELQGQMDKELAVRAKPKTTTDAFKR